METKEGLLIIGCGVFALWLAILVFGIAVGIPYGVYRLILLMGIL